MLLLSAGSNAQGQLSNGTTDDSHHFSPCSFNTEEPDHIPSGYRLLDLAFGANHTLALAQVAESQENELWGCGDGKAGQLGLAYAATTVLTRLEFDIPAGYTPRLIAAAWETSYVVISARDKPDIVISMGSNDFGDLGIGVQGKVPPKDFHVVQMDALVVRSIVAGQRHVLVLLESGEVIGWGASRHGQLGNTVEKPCVNLPTNIPVGTGVVSIAAGHHHTVFLHQSGEVTGWGSNRKHQLNCLSAIRNAGGVHCTWNGSYVVTSDGYIHSTGNSIHGQLGRELEGHTRVQLPGHGLVQIACGSEHVLAVLRGKDGQFEVWGWGWNEHGNIGTGATEDVRLPQKLCSFDSHVRVWAGMGTSWICT